MTTRDWAVMSVVVAVALALRVIFYTGFFGSDEVTYAQSAVKAAEGQPLEDIYIGAIRLGVNYPMAAFVKIFGVSEPALAAYAMLSSAAEVALVYVFAFALGGPLVAFASALLLALVPMHINLAGRLLADAPLALFMTATFVAFYFGERNGRVSWYLLAGACAGFVFWIKQATAIFLAVFLLWTLVRRRIAPKSFYAAAAFVAVVGLNLLETWRTSGNAVLLFDSMELARSHAAKFVQDVSPWTYFIYLFLDVRHTALLGWLALGGIAALSFARLRRIESTLLGRQYLLVWALGLVAVFSFFIAGTDPLRLIPKQANYMAIFLAPLSVLGGFALASVPWVWARTALLAGAAGLGVLLAGLQQQSIQAFTANSEPTVQWARERPDQVFYVMTNAYRRQQWDTLLAGHSVATNVRSLPELKVAGVDQWVVIDPVTLGWGASDPKSKNDLPTCWTKEEVIRRESRGNAGTAVVAITASAARHLAAPVAERAMNVLEPMLEPALAEVYRVPTGCGAAAS